MALLFPLVALVLVGCASGVNLEARAPETPIPTQTPEATPIPRETETPTAEPVKKPENFLPEYSVFYGQMTEEDGTAKGSIIIAHLPGYPNHLYVFDEANRSGQGYLLEIQ